MDLLVALRAAGEITRLRILVAVDGNELTVSEITQILDQSQPRVSRHLKLLCDSGILLRFQEGALVFHRINSSGQVARLTRFIIQMVDKSTHFFLHDQQRLEKIKAANSKLATEYFTKNAYDWDRIRKMAAPDNKIEAKLVEYCQTYQCQSLVDLGTGTGRILEILSPYIKKGVGIDQNREMLTVARSNLSTSNVVNCTVRQGDINQLTITPKSVDLVTIHQVLHYMENPQKVVSEAARILAPSGILVIVDFLPHNLEMLREKHAHRRLGFSKSILTQWATQYSMIVESFYSLKKHREVQAESLEVGVWVLKKLTANTRSNQSEN